MRHVLKLILFLIVVLNSCDVDFGDKAYDFINAEGYDQSKRLYESDLNVRVKNFLILEYNSCWEQLNSNQLKIKSLSKELDYFASNVYTDLETIIFNYDNVTTIFNNLIELKFHIEELESRYIRIDSLHSVYIFIDNGVWTIGRETLLRSFYEVGDATKKNNKERYSRFGMNYSIGSAENEASITVDSYSGSFEGFWVSLPIVSTIYNLWEAEEIEDQFERLNEAMMHFNEVAISSNEQYQIYKNCVNVKKENFSDHHNNAKELVLLQDSIWHNLFEINCNLIRYYEIKLKPYRIAYLQNKYKGSAEIKRILKTEEIYIVKENIIDLKVELKSNYRKIKKNKKSIDKLIYIEDFQDAVTEADFVYNYYIKTYPILSNEKIIVSFKDDIDKFKNFIQRSYNEFKNTKE